MNTLRHSRYSLCPFFFSFRKKKAAVEMIPWVFSLVCSLLLYNFIFISFFFFKKNQQKKRNTLFHRPRLKKKDENGSKKGVQYGRRK